MAASTTLLNVCDQLSEMTRRLGVLSLALEGLRETSSDERVDGVAFDAHGAFLLAQEISEAVQSIRKGEPA